MQSLDIPPIDPGMLGGDTLPDGYPFRPCMPMVLSDHLLIDAARLACEINPANHPPAHALAALDSALPGVLRDIPAPFHLALMTGKNFPTGTTLGVGFLEKTPDDLANRILAHMNAWSDGGVNLRFVRSSSSPQVRITRSGDGYWSYIGTDILSIPIGQPTMCLQAFTMSTPESEYRRVVRHETGHTMGFPHEHSRREIVALLDRTKTIRYFEATQRWSEEMIRAQILTPLDERSIRGTPHAEQDSIMCYSFSRACTVSGLPIVGGEDITPDDFAFGMGVYPGLTPAPPTAPPVPVPPAPPGPGSKPVPAAPQLRGSVGPAGKPFLVYVTDPAVGSAERGYRFRGKAWISERDRVSIIFKGPADRLAAAGAGAMPADLAAVEVPGADI